MKEKEIVNLERIINQTTSQVDFGTQLELLAANSEGDELDIGLYPLCRFVSPKKGEIQFEFYDGGKIIRLPIEELENSILTAKKWVQSEDSFDYSNEN